MTKRTPIMGVNIKEVQPGAFMVEAQIHADRRWVCHEGPKDFACFTREEAERFASRVLKAGSIDRTYWALGKIGWRA